MSERTDLKRLPERGSHDPAVINAILDEALYCHIGFVHDGFPVVIPTIHARWESILYIHGSPASRMLRSLRDGREICVTVTILDGLVLARSLFNHSMNYRSVVIFGNARDVSDRDEKLLAMEVITDHAVPGRWGEARRPNEQEFAGTAILALDIDQASAKIRSGPPGDNPEDVELPVWAGIIPVTHQFGDPQPAPNLSPDVELPAYLASYRR